MILLIPGTVYTEPNRNDRPFKICPDIVEAKDTPCCVLGPTATVVHRMEKPNEDKKEIAELQHRIHMLETKILELQRNR